MIADGPPSWLLDEAVADRIELVLPQIVLAELERILPAKLGFSTERVASTRALLVRLAASRPGEPRRIEAITGNASDDAILASATEAGADVLATGDRRHLLPVGEHRGVRVLTPQALLAELRAGG